MRITLTILAALAFAPVECLAQAKIPVFVRAANPDGNDHAGRQLIFEVKEAIKASQSFRLVETTKEWPYIRYSITTLPTVSKGTAAGYSISYDSVSMPLRGAFITSGILICPTTRIVECARGVLPDIDEAVRTLQGEAPDLWKTLR